MKKTSDIKTKINSLEIEEYLSIWNIIGQTRATSILKNAALQYINDKMEGRKVDFPSVLISGETGSGRATLARAFANAILGTPDFKQAIGRCLGMGTCIYDYFEQSIPETVFCIRGSECLSNYAQNSVVYKLLREQILHVPERTVRKMREVEFPTKPFLIFTTNKGRHLDTELNSLVDWKIELEPYFEKDIVNILFQRCKYCSWTCSSDEVLKTIAHSSKNNPGKSMELLQMSYSISRSDNRNIIQMKDVQKAIELLGENACPVKMNSPP